MAASSNGVQEENDVECSLMHVETQAGPRGHDFLPQVLACLAVSTILIQTGVNLAYSAVLLPQLMIPESDMRVTKDHASWIASIVTISTTAGSLISGPLMDKYGRKALSKFTCVPFVISWIIIAFTTHLFGIYCGRLLAGLGAGLCAAPLVYISEVSHPRWRPTLLCLISTLVSLGILLTCVLCLWLTYDKMALCFAVLSLVCYLVMWLVPESPHWLQQHATQHETRSAVKWLYRRDECYQQQLKCLMENQQPTSPSTPTRKHWLKYFEDYRHKSTIKPIVILVIIFIFQQISGAYIIIFYAVDILKLVGGEYGSGISEYMAFALLGVIRFVMSICTAFASKSYGRRPVSIISFLGMAISTLVAAMFINASDNSGNLFQTVSSSETDTRGYGEVVFGGGNVTAEAGRPPGAEHHADQWVPLACLLVYVLFSSLGVLVIPWTLIGELPPVSVRGSCGGFMMAFSYVMMFVVVKTFPYLLELIKIRGVFYVFSSTSCLGALFIFFFLPETRGKTFKEIEAYFI